jgi:hypothetical protein
MIKITHYFDFWVRKGVRGDRADFPRHTSIGPPAGSRNKEKFLPQFLDQPIGFEVPERGHVVGGIKPTPFHSSHICGRTSTFCLSRRHLRWQTTAAFPIFSLVSLLTVGHFTDVIIDVASLNRALATSRYMGRIPIQRLSGLLELPGHNVSAPPNFHYFLVPRSVEGETLCNCSFP